MRNHWIISVALTLLVEFTPGLATSSPLYQTSFEPPTFIPSLLAGQDGWFAGLGESAATVSTEAPRNGHQSVRIDGSQLQEFFGFHFGSYARILNYDPIGSGTPLIDLSGNINLSGAAVTCGLGIGLSAVLNGEFVANILIGIREQNGKFISYISNMDGNFVNGPEYFFNEWANVRAVFDFENRTVLGFFNSQFMGEIPFTAGIDNVVPAINIFLGSSQSIPGTIAYVDDFSLNAIPEPNTLALVCTAILSLLGAARSSRKLKFRGNPAKEVFRFSDLNVTAILNLSTRTSR